MNINEYLAPAGEKPLDRMVSDGGFCSIFRTIGCVGDSLSSGEFEGYTPGGQIAYLDMFEYSWGQYIARMTGSRVYNFSRGGMTAIEYCKTFAEANDFWNPDKACQAYIVALGVNDVINARQPVGSVSDICREDWHKNDPGTFAGWYGQLLQRLREIRPDAKYFLMTIPRCVWLSGEKEAIADAHAALLYDMAALFDNTYVLDLRRYAPEHDETFVSAFYMNGHMNPMGYRLTAEQVCSYIDFIIRHDPAAFRTVPFIGTTYREHK